MAWSLSPSTSAPALRRVAISSEPARRRFDVLLHMQLSLRAVCFRCVVRAPSARVRQARARELQWLFTNARIAPRSREHVLDSFFGFLEALGIHERTLRWDVPLPPAALDYAQKLIPDARPTLVISPCSSHDASQLACRSITRQSPITPRGAMGCA